MATPEKNKKAADNAIPAGAAYEHIMADFEGADCKETLTATRTRLFEAQEKLKGLREDKADLLTEINMAGATIKALEQKVKEQARLIDIYVNTLTAYQIELAKCQGVG